MAGAGLDPAGHVFQLGSDGGYLVDGLQAIVGGVLAGGGVCPRALSWGGGPGGGSTPVLAGGSFEKELRLEVAFGVH